MRGHPIIPIVCMLFSWEKGSKILKFNEREVKLNSLCQGLSRIFANYVKKIK